MVWVAVMRPVPFTHGIVFSRQVKKWAFILCGNYSVIIQIGVTLGRICNPAALNISICNAIIGLKILIFKTSGLQIPMSITLLNQS